jgi:hypothetical protein
MELFLNLLWLLIAIGAAVLWRTCWLPQKPQRQREPLREWTAIGCALVLLFFAVSLTDDLHSEVMLQEESSASRRHSICSHPPQQAKRIVPGGSPATLPQIVQIAPPQLTSLTVFLPLYPRPIFRFRMSSGRAPPIAFS